MARLAPCTCGHGPRLHEVRYSQVLPGGRRHDVHGPCLERTCMCVAYEPEWERDTECTVAVLGFFLGLTTVLAFIIAYATHHRTAAAIAGLLALTVVAWSYGGIVQHRIDHEDHPWA